MVSIKSLLATAAAALPLSSAYITNIAAPESVKAGSTLTTTLTAGIYIQNWDDFGIVWGLAPAHVDCGDIVCVGQRISYTPLFPDHEPEPGNFTVDVPIPASFTPGDYKLVAAIPYLVGASGFTEVQGHSVNITIEAA
ncbi:hypothetical protein F5Y04DRAFT_281517 [Hypomontagnella monticulosa]|nr:hypothetical protein F5Y04DRAFT_281517 [Hypomontagnella monticulosa]